MAITRCENGHFFDNAKYAECPYCSTQMQERNRYEEQIREHVTMAKSRRAVEQDVTIGLYGTQMEDDDKTVGIFAGQSVKEPVTGWLVCTEGKAKGTDYRLCHGNNWICRNSQMNICVVNDSSISRENYATIVYDGRSNRFFLTCGMGADVRVNGEILMGARELKRRDEIALEEHRFIFIPFCEEGYSWEHEDREN